MLSKLVWLGFIVLAVQSIWDTWKAGRRSKLLAAVFFVAALAAMGDAVFVSRDTFSFVLAASAGILLMIAGGWMLSKHPVAQDKKP